MILGRVLFIISVICLNFFNICWSDFDDFEFQGNPLQKVTHAGALLIKKYPANHPDGHGEEFCILLGHDCNLDSYAPPAGSVDKNKDFCIYDGKKYYLSYKALQREVLEETGGAVFLSDEYLAKCPVLYSQLMQDVLAVVRDDTLSCANLLQAVQKTLVDPSKDKDWKEMDNYCTFPVNEVIATAQVMKEHFDKGGTINNLPEIILSKRKTNYQNSPLVWVTCRGGGRLEVDAYYMAAIADTLPQFRQIVASW